MNWLHAIIADGDGPITLASILMALAAFTGGLIAWILNKLYAAVERNSALIATLVEVQIVRMTQSANPQERQEVVELLRKHADESKK